MAAMCAAAPAWASGEAVRPPPPVIRTTVAAPLTVPGQNGAPGKVSVEAVVEHPAIGREARVAMAFWDLLYSHTLALPVVLGVRYVAGEAKHWF